MTFAQPLYLLFLLFIPVIVLLHMLYRTRREGTVPSLLIWQKLLNRKRKPSWFRRVFNLHMLLQCLVVALASLALADPIFGDVTPTGGTDRVIVIDVSASMNALDRHVGQSAAEASPNREQSQSQPDTGGARGGSQASAGEMITRMELARRRVKEIVAGTAPSGRVTIVTMGSQPIVLGTYDPQDPALLDVIETLKATHEVADVRTALELAEAISRPEAEEGGGSAGTAATVHVITDGALSVPAGYDPGQGLAFHAVGSETDNIGITNFQLRPAPNGTIQAVLTVTSRGREPFEGAVEIVTEAVRQDAAGREVLDGMARLGGGASVGRAHEAGRFANGPGTRTEAGPKVTASLIPFRLGPGGAWTGAVVLPPMEQAAVTARLVSGGPNASELVAYVDAFEVDNRAYAAVNRGRRTEVALVSQGNPFLEAAFAVYPGITVTRYDRYTPEIDADLIVLDRQPAAALPRGRILSIDTPMQGVPVAPAGLLEEGRQFIWNRDHPVGQNIPSPTAYVRSGTVFVTGPEVAPLLQNGSAVVAAAYATERLSAVFLGFDLSQSNLPVDAAFPVFLHNVMRWILPEQDVLSIPSVSAGDSVVVALSGAGNTGNPGTAADGNATSVPPNQPRVQHPTGEVTVLSGNALSVSFDETQRTGIYRIRDGSGVRLLAVNLLNPEETDLTPRLGATDAWANSSGENDTFATTSSRGLWRLLALLTLLGLVADSLVWVGQVYAGTGRRRSA